MLSVLSNGDSLAEDSQRFGAVRGSGSPQFTHNTRANWPRKLGVSTLPYILSLVEGQTRPYTESQISFTKIVEFIRRSLPSDLVKDVDDTNYPEFLNGWHDNRVRTLFINEEHFIKLRYLLVAFEFRDRIAFAHVTADETSKEITTKYRVDHKMNSMLIFNEDISRTTATLSVSELKPQLMRDVLESNKFLLLPRLASQVFNRFSI